MQVVAVEKPKIEVESTDQSKLRQKNYYTVRSSALFFASSKNGMETEISFLNHFLLKRGIKKVVCFASFRDLSGQLVNRVSLEVTEPKVYSLSVRELCGAEFEGSADIEFYSVENIFVPYSAVSATYSCAKSFCQIHSYTRTYNPHELEESHIIPVGEEAGWILRDNEAGVQSVAYFHNGGEGYTTGFDLELVNNSGERRTVSIPPKAIAPYETVTLVPSDYFEVKDFLAGHVGQAAVSFKTAKVFPRLLCGNRRMDQNGRVVEFQATHSNFNYSKLDTPRMPLGETGYSFVPKVGSCEDIELLVFPHHLKTENIKAEGIQVNENVSQAKASHFSVTAGEEIIFSSTDSRGLPNRIVNSLIFNFSDERLPAECSGGILTSGYVAGNKHWYWGIAFTTDTVGILSCTLGTRFLPLDKFGKQVEIKLYDLDGECGSKALDLLAISKEPVELNSLLSRKANGTVWYRCANDYPLVAFYCSTYDAKKKSGSVEHSY